MNNNIKFDAVLQESLSTTLNIDLSDDRWTQASLPVMWWGGLGVRNVVSLAHSAYLASASSTEELTTSLLPYRLRDVVDSGIATAMSAWSRSATSPSNTSIAPSSPGSAVQRIRDNQCCEFQSD